MQVKFGIAVVVSAACVCLALADPVPGGRDELPAAAAAPVECAEGQYSVECAQVNIYRSVRSFFDQDKIDLLGGLSLIKTGHEDGSRRDGARSVKPEDADAEHVEHARNTDEREAALEEFTVHRVMRFFRERSLHWNLSPVVTEVSETARSVVDSIPPQIKSKISNYIEEGT